MCSIQLQPMFTQKCKFNRSLLEKSLFILNKSNEELTDNLIKEVLLNMTYGMKRLFNEKDSSSRMLFMQNQINRLETESLKNNSTLKS